MLNLDDIFKKWGLPSGIVHVNPQFGMAKKIYLANGYYNTIWIEPNPFFYEILEKTKGPDETVFNYLISSQNNVVYNVSLHGESSQESTIQSIDLEELMANNNIDLKKYDFLNIGIQTQPIDMNSLKIDNFKYVLIENSSIVEKEHPNSIYNIQEKLKKNGFKRVEKTQIQNIIQSFYVKKRKYNKNSINLSKN